MWCLAEMVETRFVQSVTKRSLSVGKMPVLRESRNDLELKVEVSMACLWVGLYWLMIVFTVLWYF